MVPLIALAVLLLAVTGPHAVVSQTIGCTLSTRPCRLRVTAYTFDGELVGSASTPTCSCSARLGACSDDWSSSKVISRNLLSGTHNMTFQMMFCRNVHLRPCRSGETALTVSSSLLLPTNVVSQSCQCSQSRPLMLKRSWRGADFLNYHSYVCNNDMPICVGDDAECASIENGDTTYSCTCRAGLTCRSNEAEDPHAPFHNGNCVV